MNITDPGSVWFAVWTRSRQEKVASEMLTSLGVHHYLPLKSEIRQWSDRKQTIKVPLFSGYLFVRMNPLKDKKLTVLKVPGIVSFVGNQNGPSPIPAKEIEDIKTALASGLAYSVQPTFREGDRVRVKQGALAGVEGTFIRSNSNCQLVISISMIRQSLVVIVSPEQVESLEADPSPNELTLALPRPSVTKADLYHSFSLSKTS